MKKTLFAITTLAVALGASAGSANAQEILTGDTRMACEAVLCLSSGTRPSECTPSLSRYFSITKFKFSDTIKARLNFLSLCPVSNQTPEMRSLVSAISRGAGRCDADWFNQQLRIQLERRICSGSGDSHGCVTEAYFAISNQAPSYCAAYTGHAYTDFATTTLPKYVGTPEEGGYWVEARTYDSAQAEYNARLEKQRRQDRENSWFRR